MVNSDLQGFRERVGSSIQQKLALPVLSKSECGRRFREPRPDQICAGGEEGKAQSNMSLRAHPDVILSAILPTIHLTCILRLDQIKLFVVFVLFLLKKVLLKNRIFRALFRMQQSRSSGKNGNRFGTFGTQMLKIQYISTEIDSWP